MARKIHINLLTSCSLASKDEGRELLQLWRTWLPEYLPERFGNHEPLRLEFPLDNIDAALDHWEWPFLAKRRKPSAEASIFMTGGPVPAHGWIYMMLDFQPAFESAVIGFFKAVSKRFQAEFGFIHLADAKQYLELTTHKLRANLPTFYWATILGKGYVEMFGPERIQTAPVQYIEELGDALYYVQVSDRLTDIERKSDEVLNSIWKVKSHLNSNAFFDPTLGSDHVYSIPQFHFHASCET